MVSFTINFNVKSTVGAERNETIRGCYEIQRRDKTQVKTDDSKTINAFNKVGGTTSTS